MAKAPVGAVMLTALLGPSGTHFQLPTPAIPSDMVLNVSCVFHDLYEYPDLSSRA